MAFGRARHATHERRPARHRGRVEADRTLVRSRGRAREDGARWLGVRLSVGDDRDERDLVLEAHVRSLFAPLALETREPSAVIVIRDEDELGAGAVVSERDGGSQRHDRMLDADRYLHARETSPATPRFERSAWREATKVKLARRWPVAVGEEARLVCRRQALHDETSTSVEDAPDLADRAAAVGEVMDDELHRRVVERGIAERKRRRIGLDPGDRVQLRVRAGQHAGAPVDARRAEPREAFDIRDELIPGAAADVEHAQIVATSLVDECREMAVDLLVPDGVAVVDAGDAVVVDGHSGRSARMNSSANAAIGRRNPSGCMPPTRSARNSSVPTTPATGRLSTRQWSGATRKIAIAARSCAMRIPSVDNTSAAPSTPEYENAMSSTKKCPGNATSGGAPIIAKPPITNASAASGATVALG